MPSSTRFPFLSETRHLPSLAFVFFVTLIAWWPGFVAAQPSYERPPIDYLKAPTNDPISALQKKIDAQDVRLEWSEKSGYLESVMEKLAIEKSSQVLVFSKTSFQLKRISPRSPRALYFSDDMYLGWVRGGDVIEVSSVDPKQGAIFYTLEQREREKPKFVRHTHTCLACHSSSLSSGVPGHVVRSVYPAPDGRPILSAGTYRTDHSSPLEERWGGWYVTGKHGSQRHLGNILVRGSEDPRSVDLDRGANVEDLGAQFDTSSYLTGHSDIVALMILEHQAKAHNLLTSAGFLGRVAMHDNGVMNKMLDRPDGFLSDSTKSRIRSATEPLVRYLLFCDETRLDGKIEGTSGFAREFQAKGVRDSQGRSLRDLDLERRLFRYPLSYLIYSKPFDSLPAEIRDQAYHRLWEVLSGEDSSEDFGHLSHEMRKAILEILRETKSDLPKSWRKN